MRFYQPVPFPEFLNVNPSKVDCETRYDVIKKNYGDYTGKTLLDVCSANCYFGFRFLQDGGSSVVAVENDGEVLDFVRKLASEKGENLLITDNLFDVLGCFDVALYLDTHFHEGTKGYLEKVKELSNISFISASKDNEELYRMLTNLYKNVEGIYQGYQDRIIYKCY